MKSPRCCLAGIGETIMTRNGFISACLARQFKQDKMDPCLDCKKGKAIKAGKWPGSPEGIIIFIPVDFTPGPIIYPKPKTSFVRTWTGGRTPKYPFSTMEIEEIYKGDVENKRNLRSACGQIARKYGKKFVNHIDGDFIIFERTK